MSDSEKIMRCMVTLTSLPVRADQSASLGKTIMDVVAVLNDVHQSVKEREDAEAQADDGG